MRHWLAILILGTYLCSVTELHQLFKIPALFSHYSEDVQERPDEGFFCFLAEGELKVTKNGKILNLLTAGDCFGEMAIISKATQLRGADVVALTESKIITVRGETLKRASETCRMHFYQSFLEVLANRLTLANQRLAAF